MRNFALTLMGPTASGKTSLGIKLAHELNGEIISVDSALIYRGMDIGTAKPTIAEQEGIPHHLIDILDPKQSYSVAEFRHDALQLIAAIHAKGKIPILVGGTMLYFKALIEGLSPLPKSTEEVRTQVNSIIATQGLPYLRSLVQQIDPESWARINENDAQRLGRVYEVYLLTQKSMTEIIREHKNEDCGVDFKEFAILPTKDRSDIKPLISQRFDQMLSAGLVEEVRQLYNRGDLNLQMPSIRSVGYRQLWGYLAGEYSLEEARSLAIIATCQLAKRQMTWLRGWKSAVTYLPPHQQDNVAKILAHL